MCSSPLFSEHFKITDNLMCAAGERKKYNWQPVFPKLGTPELHAELNKTFGKWEFFTSWTCHGDDGGENLSLFYCMTIDQRSL